MSTLNFNVAGDPGNDQPTLAPDNPADEPTLTGHFEGTPPNRWVVTIPPEVTGGAWVFWRDGQCRVIVPPGEGAWEAGLPPCQPPEDDTIAMIYQPPIVVMPDLSVVGQFLRSGGQRFTLIDRTGFALVERVLREGINAVRPFCAQGQALGFNSTRIFLMNTSVHHLLPWEWPNFFETLTVTATVLAQYGQYPHFVAFTQTQTLMPNPTEQVDYLRGVFETLYETPCLISLVNENDQHDNRVSDLVRAESKPAGAAFLYSRGSNGAGAQTVLPVANYGEGHYNDLPEWQRKTAHNPMEDVAWAFKVPGVASENTRSDKDKFNLVHARDAAAGGALLHGGSCCHTPEGKLAQPWVESCEWAQAWADGARSVPLEYQDGFYRRLVDPAYLRVYQRVLPDGRAWTVRIRA